MFVDSFIKECDLQVKLKVKRNTKHHIRGFFFLVLCDYSGLLCAEEKEIASVCCVWL